MHIYIYVCVCMYVCMDSQVPIVMGCFQAVVGDFGVQWPAILSYLAFQAMATVILATERINIIEIVYARVG